MDNCKYVFDQLGPNKVTHPIEIDVAFVEGRSEMPQNGRSWSKQLPQDFHGSSCDTRKNNPNPSASKSFQPSLLTSIMLWKMPSISLLPEKRIVEELLKFKQTLIKTATHFEAKKLKTLGISDRQDLILKITNEKYDAYLFEFMGCIWDVAFITENGIHGTITSSMGHWISSMPPYEIIEKQLDEYRSGLISFKLQNLKTAKEIKDFMIALKLPTTKIDEQTNKRRALLKTEMQELLRQLQNTD